MLGPLAEWTNGMELKEDLMTTLYNELLDD